MGHVFFVPDRINSVVDYSSPWVSVVCVSCVPIFFMFQDWMTFKPFDLSSWNLVRCNWGIETPLVNRLIKSCLGRWTLSWREIWTKLSTTFSRKISTTKTTLINCSGEELCLDNHFRNHSKLTLEAYSLIRNPQFVFIQILKSYISVWFSATTWAWTMLILIRGWRRSWQFVRRDICPLFSVYCDWVPQSCWRRKVSLWSLSLCKDHKMRMS